MASEMDYQRALEFDRRRSRLEILRHLTQILIDELEPEAHDRVLDVGGGTGWVARALTSIITKGVIVGIDSGAGMVRVAMEKLAKDKIENIRLVLGRAESLPFLPQVFDSAYMMLAFHHFSQPEGALKNIQRVLKPNGRLVTVDPVLSEGIDEEGKRLQELIEEAFQLDHGAEFRFFTAPELRGLFEKVGFSIVDFQTYEFPFDQKGLEGIPMGPHWLHAYEYLFFKNEERLVQRFERDYFSFRDKAGVLMVKGKITWATIKASKSGAARAT